jgi:probable HAF family extracellular repeat protein
MKPRTSTCITAIILFALAIPLPLASQEARYRLVDTPTLGGPGTIGQVDGTSISQFINNPGVVVGGADTSIHDPTAPGCADCFLVRAFRWQDGAITDLGALPGVNFSHAESINARGWATGGSFTAEFDPLKGQPAEHAVLWKGDEITDLGTLGTGRESAALYVNNAGEVIGFSTFDTTPDPSSFLGATIHAFIWRDGVMTDLGTLGGSGSFPAGGCNNERAGLVAGMSFTNSTLNPTTGSPTQHAFLWENGTMTDIPTLGGTFATAQCANNRGQVIGQSNLTGDPGCDGSAFDGSCFQHAFSWDHETLTDLRPLGGSSSVAFWLNNDGEAVGGSSAKSDNEFHATLWKNGGITDLDPDDCISFATAINSKHQIIGNTFNCDTNISRTVVWDNGSIIDLNAAIPSNPSLFLVEPDNINDRGEIVGRGAPPGCDPANLDSCGHVFLLIPCDRADTQGCEGNGGSSGKTASATISTLRQRREMTSDFMVQLRARLAQKYHRPGIGIPK